MAADLHIHVLLEPCTEDDLAVFFRNTMGSKWFGGLAFRRQYSLEREQEALDHVVATPSVWIGEVSWLKAGLSEDPSEYVPEPVGEVSRLIGEELPMLTPEFRDALLAAANLRNQVGFYEVAHVGRIRKFLDEHIGKRLFTVSW
jgi:hypothetical protein